MDRRAHYLQTALRLFAEHGYNGVSMDQLVAAAGGSKATLYRYFASKEELFDAIIDDLRGSTLEPGMALDPATTGLAEGLARLGHAVAAAGLSERAIVLMRLAMGEYNRFPELGRSLFARGPAVSYRLFGEFIAGKQALGEVAMVDVDIAAEQFLGGIVGHQQLRTALGVSTPTEAEMKVRVDAAVEAFLQLHALPAERAAAARDAESGGSAS